MTPKYLVGIRLPPMPNVCPSESMEMLGDLMRMVREKYALVVTLGNQADTRRLLMHTLKDGLDKVIQDHPRELIDALAVCDESVNTPSAIASGEPVRVVIFFKTCRVNVNGYIAAGNPDFVAAKLSTLGAFL